jgi:hypothetical protein
MVVMMLGYGSSWPFWEVTLMWVGMIAFWGFLIWAVYALITSATRKPDTGQRNVAIEAADITLISGSLAEVATAIALSKATMRNIRQNLFFALAYNGIGIPVAAGILYPFTGIRLSPVIAAAAMAMSSLSVVINASRLRRWHPAPCRRSTRRRLSCRSRSPLAEARTAPLPGSR